jgi:hypothetical protein
MYDGQSHLGIAKDVALHPPLLFTNMVRSRNVQVRNAAESGKRRPGRKGNFHGPQLELLESFLPDWDKARQDRTTGDFWSTVTSAYWKKFPWGLQYDEEPSGDIPTDEKLKEELEKKAAAIRLVEQVRHCEYFSLYAKLATDTHSFSHCFLFQQIRSYYNNKRNQARMKNVFGPWLVSLRKPLGPAPKAISDHQFYMRHPQYKEKVAKEYEALHPDGCAGDNAIKERNKIAARLLQNEPKEVHEALKREAAEELKAAKLRHAEAMKGRPSDIPEDIAEYVLRSAFSSFLLFFSLLFSPLPTILTLALSSF